MHLYPDDILTNTPNCFQGEQVTTVKWNMLATVAKQDIACLDHAILFVHTSPLIFHTDNKSVLLNSQEAIFLSRGIYKLSSMGLDNQTIEFTAFFLQDTFLEETIRRNSICSAGASTNHGFTKLPLSGSGKKRLVDAIACLSQNSSKSIEPCLTAKLSSLFNELLDQEEFPELINFFSTLNSASKPSLKEFLSDSTHQTLPLPVLLRLLNRDEAEFRLEFQKTFGATPETWLQSKRLEKAYFLLTHTPDSVQEISKRTGFSNTSSFSDAFQKAYDMTPQQVSEQAGK